MPVFGLVQGAQPIIGYNFGAGRLGRVRRTLRLAVIAATVVVCAGFALAQALPGLLLRAFTRDPLLLAVGVPGMRIFLAMLPVVGFQIVAANFFQAVGKARTSLLLSLLRQVIVLIPLLLILPDRFGLVGVWAAGPVSDAAASLLSAVLLLHELRALRRQGERSADEGLEPAATSTA
jgi:Na+-driven multidrug efflux pump